MSWSTLGGTSSASSSSGSVIGEPDVTTPWPSSRVAVETVSRTEYSPGMTSTL
jgi:hypothetical protein